jgi:hypothetical protein
LLGGIMESVSL